MDSEAPTEVVSPGSALTAPAGEGDQLDKVFEVWQELLDKGYFLENHATYSWQEAQAPTTCVWSTVSAGDQTRLLRAEGVLYRYSLVKQGLADTDVAQKMDDWASAAATVNAFAPARDEAERAASASIPEYYAP